MTFNELNAVRTGQPTNKFNWATCPPSPSVGCRREAPKFLVRLTPKLKHGVSILFSKFTLSLILQKYGIITLPFERIQFLKFGLLFLTLPCNILNIAFNKLKRRIITLPFRVGIKASPTIPGFSPIRS